MKIFKCATILLLIHFSATTSSAASYGSLATIEHTKRRVTALYRNYIKFDKELESFRGRQKKHFVPSNYNISLKKEKNTDLALRRVELLVDGNPYYSSSFGNIENFALSRGGREILFFGPLTHGRHSLTFKVLVEDPKTKSILVHEDTKKISVEKDITTYHELLIAGSSKSPEVLIVPLGHK